MGAPAGAAPTAAAAVVEASDVAEGDRWKAMSDAFSFDDLSEDDADARVGGGRGGTMRAHAEGTRRGEDRAEAPSTPTPRVGSLSDARRLLPVRWLEGGDAESRDGADRGAIPGDEGPQPPASAPAADAAIPNAGAEATDALAARFARDFRAVRPFLTRAVARKWMSGSALGRGGALGALEAGDDASRVGTTLLFAKDNATFLGRGELCDRTDDVPLGEAWAHVAAHAAGKSRRRCYFRAPLAESLRRDIDFADARRVFGGGGGGGGGDACSAAREEDASGSNPPPPPFTERAASVWVSSPGCITPLHFDLCHGLLTQLSGRKRVLLVAPEHARSLHRNPRGRANPNSSPVDLPAWLGLGDDETARARERERHPRVANVVGEVYECVLTPGDTLYVPPFWWHHVTTLERASTSLLLAFDPDAEESVHPCVEDE
jgi:hypothetical protein